MIDLVSKLLDHGLAGALATVAIAAILWHAKWTFLNFRAVNIAMADQTKTLSRVERDMGRLLERHGLESIPPPTGAPTPIEPEASSALPGGLPADMPRKFFPRKSTPLPWLASEVPTDRKEEP